ncbi:ribonuclease D [Thiogranum longum]|uniref:Ribonuclease D n=1 Tax=Thiogranum longum TaxID=1537524 RepID=A0A4R1HC68_9GAMM|nr:ribonuclease D [Thiogranum longum]TCK18201.1 ribonuclease D [Thiogranum longum]
MNDGERSHPVMEYIDTPEALREFCTALKGCEWLALDTEFIREKTYYPKLCLVQVGVPGRCACIDPLALESLEPLYDLMFDTSITKVLHACSQDQEIFANLAGKVPTPIFDTQLASPLLGFAEQIGYGNFIKEVLGVSLEKAHARADWSRRPLSGGQLEYAADDVRYLAEAYPLVRARLAEQGRLAWLDAEFSPYEQLERYQIDPPDAWKRIRGLEKLRPRALSVVQQLATWREQTAQEKDLPRNWVIKDEILIDIARLAPQKVDELSTIRGMPPKSVSRYGQQLIEQVALAADQPLQPLEARGRRERASAQEEALTDVLHAQLRLLADKHGINSTLIAGRKNLLALIRDEKTPLLSGWRREIAGEELLALRDGQRLVSVRNRHVVIEKVADNDEGNP